MYVVIMKSTFGDRYLGSQATFSKVKERALKFDSKIEAADALAYALISFAPNDREYEIQEVV